MKKTLCFVTLLAALSLVLLSQATVGKGKILGTVLDEKTGQPLEGVTVKLFLVKAVAYYSPAPKTDSSGKFKALHIRDGMWNLDFEKVGYEPKKISYIVNSTPGMRRGDVEIKLKKLEGPALDANVVEEINKARDMINENKIQEGIKEFELLKEKYKEVSGIAIVNLYIGNAYSQKEEYEKAIGYFKEALEKYPNNVNLILSIGNAYSNLNQAEQAMEWFNKIPFDQIDNTDTLYNIGISFYNAFKYDDAIKYFQKAVELNAEFAPAYYQLGMTYTAMNKTSEAVEALKKFMELAPDSPDFQTAKAIVDAFSN
ncbi:MAG: tetratricopeptide repeat protein [Candidatus Aminicenantes bacterium]|nr:tetratricopeptide repeat protein [Candidatus Aminicenantes bacterium]